MPKRLPTNSVAEERLLELVKRGVDSDVLRARLEWSDAESVARYLRPLATQARCRPNVLPTAQASGRWSWTEPPLVNFPRHPQGCPECPPDGSWCPRDVRNIIRPDPGTWWLKGDADAIEARLAAAYTRDQDDLEAFALGHDVHTLKACSMFGLPMPLVRRKVELAGPEAAAWRQEVGWQGGDDPRRIAAKAFRYASQYGLDVRAVLLNKDVARLGLDHTTSLAYAEAYRRSKPAFYAARQVIMEQCARLGQARTFLGRLRRLYGDQRTRMKEGFAHMCSGAVVDIVNAVVIEWSRRWPQSWLVLNAYDALTLGFRDDIMLEGVVASMREMTERPHDVYGQAVVTPWSWSVVR